MEDELEFYDKENGISVSISRSPDHSPIEVVLPSMAFLTAEQARRFASALLAAAAAVDGEC